MKFLTCLILVLVPSLSFGLEIQQGVYKGSAREVQVAESKHKLPAWVWIGFVKGNDEPDPLHKVRKRATLIVHHENEKADVHYVIVWSHGMGGFHKFSENMFPQLKELVARGKSFTLIEPELPWSCNVSQIDGRKSWSVPGSFKTFVEEAKLRAPKLKTSKRVLLVIGGHSRGGKSIKDAAASGGLCEMNPDWVLWSESTYSDWLQKSWRKCLKNAPDRVEIFYLRGAPTNPSVTRLKKEKGHNLVHVRQFGIPWFHRRVGDHALIMSDFLK